MKLELVTPSTSGELATLLQHPDAIMHNGAAAILYFLFRREGKAIGYTSIHDVDDLARHGQTSTFVLPEERGDYGATSRAFNSLLDYAKKKMNLRKLYSETVDPRVSRAMVRAGWEVEATLSEAKFVDGNYVPLFILSKLTENRKSEWDG